MKIETLNRYNEPSRVYHTLQHIYTMFDVARYMGLKLTRAQTIAIFYHDVIYKPGSDRNEEMSAKLMYKEEKDNFSRKIAVTAYQIILSTVRHEPLCREAADVIDLDLFGLAQRDNYWNIRDMVSREFIPVIGTEKWETGRLAWLEFMIKKEKIFHGFYKGHDAEARRNLSLERQRIMTSLTVPNADGVVRNEEDI